MCDEIGFLLTPEGSFLGKEFADGHTDFLRVGGRSSDFEALQEFDVTFFLPRDNVMHQHGALRGEGLVDGRSAGFANDEVVGAKEVGNFFGPAFECDAVREFLFDFVSPAVEAPDIVAQYDGHFGIVFQNSPHDFANMGGTRGGEVENLEGRNGGVRGEFGEFAEARADRESGDGDFFRWDFLCDQ